MGSALYYRGVTVRVWAPFASSVFAAGAFNEWSETVNPFASEGNGYWSVDLPGAKIGDEYQF
jgi:1,4-alpha-glucan branching enzyme